MTSKKILVLGPNSCGKSLYSEHLFSKYSCSLVYLATLEVCFENNKRIDIHAKRRDSRWSIIQTTSENEANQKLIRDISSMNMPVLIDGLTMMFYRIAKRYLCSEGKVNFDSMSVTAEMIVRAFSLSSVDWVIVDYIPTGHGVVMYPNTRYGFFIRDLHDQLKSVNEVEIVQF